MEYQTKDITSATETVVHRLKRQTLTESSLLVPFINKVVVKSGRNMYPFVDVVDTASSNFTIGSIELLKTNDFTIAEVTNETREDTNLAIGIDSAVQNILDIQMVKRMEKKIVESLVADTAVHYTMSLTWDGIKSGIVALGGDIFSIVGTIYVAVSLTNYLDIIEQPEFVNAMKVLGNRVQLVVMEQFANNQMLVMHEYGVAGGLMAKNLELDPQPGLDRTDYIAPFTYAFGWDPKYVKFST